MTRFLLKFFFRLQVYGQENIPRTGGFILAANHTSYMDPPILGATSARKVAFMAKQELFRNAFYASLLKGLNTFAVDQEFARRQSLRLAIKILKSGMGLVVFPEGRRTFDGELDRPRRGVGLLAEQADVPIVPAFIQGAHQALPRKSKSIRLAQIKVYFGQSIRPQDDIRQTGKTAYQDIAEKTMQQIARLKRMSN